MDTANDNTIRVTSDDLTWVDSFQNEIHKSLEKRKKNGEPFSIDDRIRHFAYSMKSVIIMKSGFRNIEGPITPFISAYTLIDLCDQFSEDQLEEKILDKFHIVIPIILSAWRSMFGTSGFSISYINSIYARFCNSGILAVGDEDVYYIIINIVNGQRVVSKFLGLKQYLAAECKKFPYVKKMWKLWEIKTKDEMKNNRSYSQWFPREIMEDILSLL